MPIVTFENYKVNKINLSFIKECQQAINQELKRFKARSNEEISSEITRIYYFYVNLYEAKYGKKLQLPSISTEFPKSKKKKSLFDKQFFDDMESGMFDEE